MSTAPAASPALAAVREALDEASRLVLTSHLRPDGDALGSEIALAHALRARGKEVVILNVDPAPRTLDWLMDQQPEGLVQMYEPGDLSQAEAVANADLLVVLDTNAKHRLGDVGDLFAQASAPVVLIDHHPDPETWFDLACTHTDAAATAEMVYDLIEGWGLQLIDEAVATALYVGILTDTGSFRYRATTPRTHAIVADILTRGGISPEPIHIAVFDGRSQGGLRLLAASLQTIETHYNGRLATMWVDGEMIRRSGALFDETEGLISYALGLDGVVAAVIFLEVPSGVKASFRSKGDCPINKWAGQFGGGGHANASGAFIKDGQLRRTIKDVVDAAPIHVAAAEIPEDTDGGLSEADLALLASFNSSQD
ncbi:MAG: DHH family phosphoesterase [Bacteroidota bacterium]